MRFAAAGHELDLQHLAHADLELLGQSVGQQDAARRRVDGLAACADHAGQFRAVGAHLDRDALFARPVAQGGRVELHRLDLHHTGQVGHVGPVAASGTSFVNMIIASCRKDWLKARSMIRVSASNMKPAAMTDAVAAPSPQRGQRAADRPADDAAAAP